MNDLDVAPTRHRLDVDAYHRMGEVGIFGPEERVELIEGELIDMAPIGDGHASIVDRLTRVFVMACGDAAIVRIQGPVRLNSHTEVQPDLSILRPRVDFYVGGPPGPEDVLLLAEVADSSLRFDRGVKLPLYARVGIPEAWVVDVKQHVVDVHRQPVGSGFGEMLDGRTAGTVALAAAPGIAIPVARVLDAMGA